MARGLITYDEFLFAGSFRVETPPTGHRGPSRGHRGQRLRADVPRGRRGIADGLLEHPLRPLRDTIAVLETMDEVRRQLTAQPEPEL